MSARRVPPPRQRPASCSLPSWLTTLTSDEQPESDAVSRHRRRVVAATAATGSSLLAAALSSKPGSPRFYALTLGAAGTWLVGGLSAGPLHLAPTQTDPNRIVRAVLGPIAAGAAAFGVFYVAALGTRRIPLLNDAIVGVLRYAQQSSDPLVLAATLASGIGEEVFFRGAVFALSGASYPVATSTGLYVLTTTATRNPALVLAAGVMGTLFGLQRHSTGSIQAPILTHLTWSTLMLRYLPPRSLRRA